MEVKIISYLEEYARTLRLEFDALIDRSLNDSDDEAGKQAEALVGKIKDIRGTIKRLVHEKEKHL